MTCSSLGNVPPTPPHAHTHATGQSHTHTTLPRRWEGCPAPGDTAQACRYYVAQSSDSLASIAMAFSVKLDDIKAGAGCWDGCWEAGWVLGWLLEWLPGAGVVAGCWGGCWNGCRVLECWGKKWWLPAACQAERRPRWAGCSGMLERTRMVLPGGSPAACKAVGGIEAGAEGGCLCGACAGDPMGLLYGTSCVIPAGREHRPRRRHHQRAAAWPARQDSTLHL